MNAFLKHSIAVLYGLLLSAGACAAEGQLQLPDFNGRSGKASESVTITPDAALLGLAARFLDPAKPQDAAVREAIAGIKGIYVRKYKFEQDFAYPKADVEMVRKQLG